MSGTGSRQDAGTVTPCCHLLSARGMPANFSYKEYRSGRGRSMDVPAEDHGKSPDMRVSPPSVLCPSLPPSFFLLWKPPFGPEDTMCTREGCVLQISLSSDCIRDECWAVQQQLKGHCEKGHLREASGICNLCDYKAFFGGGIESSSLVPTVSALPAEFYLVFMTVFAPRHRPRSSGWAHRPQPGTCMTL